MTRMFGRAAGSSAAAKLAAGAAIDPSHIATAHQGRTPPRRALFRRVPFGARRTAGGSAEPVMRFTPPQQGGDLPSRSKCRSEEHTSELQSLMRRSYAAF